MRIPIAFTCIYTVCLWAAASAQTQKPPGFVPPDLHPEGARLETLELGHGVYALVSDKPPVDNAGFVVGERGVLVIDAHIDEAMARQILDAVRDVTDKPIPYLVNTNYHADHTFGNRAIPVATIVIAHRETRHAMEGFEEQKRRMLATVRNDRRFSAALDVRIIVPGHGALGQPGLLDRYVDNLDWLASSLVEAKAQSRPIADVLRFPLPERFSIMASLPSARFYRGLHAFNLQRSYLEEIP